MMQEQEKETNSGFLNNAKEWASELLNGQTKAGKVKDTIYGQTKAEKVNDIIYIHFYFSAIEWDNFCDKYLLTADLFV